VIIRRGGPDYTGATVKCFYVDFVIPFRGIGYWQISVGEDALCCLPSLVGCHNAATV
jgi:hypothetical protein